mgnify:CR=1 FL=1
MTAFPYPHPHHAALMCARWAFEATRGSSLTCSLCTKACTKRSAERDGNREVDSMAEVDGT